MENKKKLLANLGALVASLGIASVAPDAGLAMIFGNMGINLGSQYIYDTVNPTWQRLLKGNDGILNHDIQKALVLAIQKAYKQIKEGYIKEHQPDAKEKNAIEQFLTDLSSEATKHLLSESAGTEPVKAEELLQYLSFTNTQETYPQLAERLKLFTPMPNEWSSDGLSEQFLHFFKEHLAPLVKEEFVLELDNNSMAKTKVELLYFECLQQSVTLGNTEILEAIKNLQKQTTENDTYTQIWIGAIHKFNDRLVELKKGQDTLLSEVQNRTDKIQQAIDRLTPSAIIPDFKASDKYNRLLAKIILGCISIDESGDQGHS